MADTARQLRDSARRWIAMAGENTWVTLVVAGTIVGCVWAFVALADEVSEGDTESFDQAISQQVAQWRLDAPGWVTEIVRDCTALGGIAILAMVTLAVVGFLVLTRKWHAAVLLTVATIGANLLSWGLKNLFGRERPDLTEHLSHVTSASFPSGHSMLAATVWLTLGVMLSRLVQGPRLKLYCFVCCAVPPVLVGFSRVWTGVHWPTDVLAGWFVGCAWALACWMVINVLQHRGKVERDTGLEHADEEPPAIAPIDKNRSTGENVRV